jgi:hypothetical protein
MIDATTEVSPEVDHGRDVAGYIVVIREHDRWHDNWDGTVHLTRGEGEEALAAAGRAGYEAALTVAVIVAENGDD